MSKRLLWLIVSVLMVFSLILAACGPSATQPQPTPSPAPSPAPAPSPSPVLPTPQPPQQEPVKQAAEAPKYGGTLTMVALGAVALLCAGAAWTQRAKVT